MAARTADVKSIFGGKNSNSEKMLRERARGLCAIHGEYLDAIDEELQVLNDELFKLPQDFVSHIADSEWRA